MKTIAKFVLGASVATVAYQITIKGPYAVGLTDILIPLLISFLFLPLLLKKDAK